MKLLACTVAASLGCLLAGQGIAAERVGGDASAVASAGFTVSGFAYIDADRNGQPSVWERGLPGATVTLLNREGAVARTGLTDAAGNYSIANVRQGRYRITLAAVSGYLPPVSFSIVVTGNRMRNLPLGKEKSLEERVLNAFGDPWSIARVNPSLPLVGGAGCYRVLAPGMASSFTPEELAYFQRLDATFFLESCADLLETKPENLPDAVAGLKARLAQLKATNGTKKLLGYNQVVAWEYGKVGASHIYNNRRDWFLYKPGASTRTDADIVRAHGGAFVLDISNSEYQDYITSRLAEALVEYGMDGFFLDMLYPLHGVADVPGADDALRARWEEGGRSILAKLKAKLGSERFVFVNAPQRERDYSLTLIPLVDGFMLEDAFSPLSATVATDRRRQIIDAATAAGKWMIASVNTFVDGSTYATTSYQREKALDRYYLAAYYIFRQGKMLFYSNPPTAALPQYGAEAFFADWNLKVGQPLGARTSLQYRLYRRDYRNSVVFLNDHNKVSYTVTPPKGFEYDPEGNKVTSYTLPPKSGIIFSRPIAFR